MPKKLKVFHGLVNYGTQAGLLARGLRDLGVDARAYTKADLFYRQTDYHFKPRKSLLAKVFFYKIWYPIVLISCFFRYNTFHFYFGQTLLKNQRDMPFYRIFGKKVVMEYLGNDIRHYETLVNRYKLPVYHYYYKNMKEHDMKVKKRVISEGKYVDYLISCLPTHVDFARNYDVEIKEVLPIAIDTRSISYIPLDKKNRKEKISILHTPTNRIFKGTKYIEQAIEKLQNEGYNLEFCLVEGVTHKELFNEYENCDLFIDQISVGWYGTAALEAMAVGRPTCAFIDKRYYKYISYYQEIPVVNINKDNLYKKLKTLIEHREILPALGTKSRKFVEKYHDVKNVSQNLKYIYEEKVWGKA